MFFPSGSASDGGFGGAWGEGEGAWDWEGGAWGGGVEEGWRAEADRNMSCHAGVVEDGSEYGTSSMMVG